MTNWEEIIERLEAQNMLPDTSESQIEANEFRCKWLRWINEEKSPHTPPVFFDPVTTSVMNPGVILSPQALMMD